MRMLAFCEEILKEKRSWSSETSVLHFFKSSESRLSPPVLFDTGGDETDDPPTDQEEVPFSEIVSQIVCVCVCVCE